MITLILLQRAFCATAYTGRQRGTTKAAPARARALRKQGLTVLEIAKALGVKERTVYYYLQASE